MCVITVKPPSAMWGFNMTNRKFLFGQPTSDQKRRYKVKDVLEKATPSYKFRGARTIEDITRNLTVQEVRKKFHCLVDLLIMQKEYPHFSKKERDIIASSTYIAIAGGTLRSVNGVQYSEFPVLEVVQGKPRVVFISGAFPVDESCQILQHQN